MDERRNKSGFGGWGRSACALASLTLCLVACGAAGQRRGVPLYPTPAQPLEPNEVALLEGYVAEVDGEELGEEDVGGVFELLPGCHIVQTPPEWTRHQMDGAVMVETGVLRFALPMRGGHSYEIRIVLGNESTETGSAVVVAVETDAKGDKTQTFEPTRDEAALEACGT
jgi:hypothetical protein